MSTFSWSSFSLFFSASTTQSFLKRCYQARQLPHAEKKSYEGCYPFIYYLEHGKVYYEQAKISPLIIQPILLFYGFVHLIKACILTIDPNYPETTTVLAHGVSTRKRKKQQYYFFEDEVKIQRNGLFPFMCEQLFHMKQLEGEKITMNDLFKQIPELDTLFHQLDRTNTFCIVKNINNKFHIPMNVLDSFHMTESRFAEFFASKSLNTCSYQGTNDSCLIFIMESQKEFDRIPLKFNLIENTYSFPLTKSNQLVYHELLIHYLLLYNLSMIARYETEWWSELTKTMPNKDYPFIETFLHLTLVKGPFMVYQYLISQ